MRSANRSSKWIAVLGMALAVAIVAGIAVVGSPALFAQEDTAPETTAEEGTAPEPAGDEAAPAAAPDEEAMEVIAVPTSDPEPSVPPAVVVAQATGDAEEIEGETTGEIEVSDLATGPADEQLRRFRADLARRAHPNDKAEMIQNEHIWYRNNQQLDYNDLPAHQMFPCECGSEWWSEYCGN